MLKEVKYSEFHRKIIKNGWKFLRAEGSHYLYIKEDVISPPVPFHGAKEAPEGLRKSITKEMGLK
jgi:predicted RNA binding protein YcfA (HicA-like mRNA interferase family)